KNDANHSFHCRDNQTPSTIQKDLTEPEAKKNKINPERDELKKSGCYYTLLHRVCRSKRTWKSF
ncbi:MAG: hypothetical protein ACRC4N_04900, partial [Gammaproteobacteria bacterium]